tara:strand:+ start:184 stop:2031 length:1848 start_codon:yes stop_codon:yes gene_type:complete
MALAKIQFKPGIDKQVTQYGAEGRWVDATNMRFRSGLPEKIGGWTSVLSLTLVGVARAMKGWVSLAGVRYVAIGTDRKLYIYSEGQAFDITPVRRTQVRSNPFTTTNNSAIVTVTDASHGSIVGDFVKISSLGNAVNTLVLNDKEFEILTVPTANTYTIQVTNPAATANATGTPSVGNTTFTYDLTNGTATSSYGLGWGTGTWGTGTWGTARSGSTLVLDATYWSFDTFGEDLLALRNDGALYKWDLSNGTSAPAVAVSGAPTSSRFLLVSSPDRHIFLFGTETIVNSQVSRDDLFLRFSSQENPSVWSPASTNSAGSFRIQDGSRIVTAQRSRGSILVWTDSALYSLNNIGPPFIFGLNQIGANCGGISAGCAVDVNGASFWMSQTAFYMFDGAIKKLPCTVQDFVFDDIDSTTQQQVTAAVNTDFNEVTWFYPTEGSEVLNASVTYNYLENVWYTNTGFTRTTWMDRGIYANPYAVEYEATDIPTQGAVQGVTAGATYVWAHEDGFNAAGNSMPSSITSGDFDIADGEDLFHCSRVIPDFKNQTGTADITVTFSNFPATTAVRTFTSTVGATTNQFSVRGRGRQANLKIDTNSANANIRFGTLRLDIKPDGRR